MNSAEIVNHTRPEQLHLQAFHCTGEIARPAHQTGQTGPLGGIEPLDVGGIDEADLGLGLNQQTARCAPVAIGQAPLDMGQALAAVALDDLDDIQPRPWKTLGPPSFATVFGGKQLLDHLWIGSKTIDSDQDGLNDAPRGLTHLRHDPQDEMLVPIQRYSTPNEKAGKHA